MSGAFICVRNIELKNIPDRNGAYFYILKNQLQSPKLYYLRWHRLPSMFFPKSFTNDAGYAWRGLTPAHPREAWNMLLTSLTEGKSVDVWRVGQSVQVWLSGRIKVCKHRQSFLCLSNVLLTVINKTVIVRLQTALNLMFVRILSGNCRWNLSYAVSTTRF